MSKELKIFDRWGYADSNGNIILEARFKQAGHFVHGLAPVKEEEGGKWGYINPRGEYVMAAQYDYASCFNERYGVAPVSVDGKSGVIDLNGDWVIAPRFERIWCVVERYELLLAEKDGLRGYIDFGGHWVIQPRWEWTEELSVGLILVQDPETMLYGFVDLSDRIVLKPQLKDEPKYGIGHLVINVPDGDDEKYGVLDLTGQWVIEPQFDDLEIFSARHSIAAAKKDGLWGVIDREGRWVCEPKFGSIGSFDNSFALAPASINNRYGYINPHGEWMIEPKFQYAEDFEDRSALAKVKQRNRWGFIDKEGHFAIVPTFTGYLGGFDTETGYCHVSERGEDYHIDRKGNRVEFTPDAKNDPYPVPIRLWGMKDGKGNMIVPPTYNQLYGPDERGRVTARVKHKFGVLDRQGKWMIEPIYDNQDIIPYRKEMLGVVVRDGKYGFMDYEGVEVIPCQFDYAEKFEEETGLAPVWVHEKCGLIDRYGQWRAQPIYNEIEIVDGIIKVERDGLWGTVDTDGNTVIPCQFDSMSSYNADLDRWLVEKDFLQGYCDGKGNVVIPIQFEEAQPFHSKTPVAAVRVGAMWGMIDDNGNWLCKPQFEDIDNYFNPDDGPIPVAKEDKCGYVDIYGNEVIPFIFKYLYGFDRKGDGTAECTLLDGREVIIDRTGKIIQYLDNDNT